MTTLRLTPAPSNNGNVTVGEAAYAEEVAANVVALWARAACWLDNVGGTPNNITANANPPLTALPSKPMAFWLVPIADNTAAVTLNIDNFGAIAVTDAATVGLNEGDISAASLHLLVFDGTQHRKVMGGSDQSLISVAPDFLISETQSAGVDGGTFTSGAMRNRIFNTSDRNVLPGASLDATTGIFTLQPGTYYIRWSIGAHSVNRHETQLLNVSDNIVVDVGTDADTTGGSTTFSEGGTVITITTAKQYRFQHRCESTSNTNGFGRATSFTTKEVYGRAMIHKVGSLASQNTGIAGGAITLSYSFSTTTTDSDPGAGVLRLDNATQNLATTIRTDLQDFGLTTVTSILDQLDASTNPVKGQIRLVKYDDPTKWLDFNFTARAAPAGYRNLTVTNIASSAASPFVDGDRLILAFSRVGDVGAQGAQGTAGSSAGTPDYRNILFANGSFEIWQRGSGDTSSIAVAASTTAYTADRWYLTTGANQAFTVSAQAGLTNQSQFCARVQRNNGQTGTAAVKFGFPLTKEECVRLRGQALALQLWTATGANWSPTSGTLTYNVYFGTGAEGKRGAGFTGETNPLSGTINLAQGASAAQTTANSGATTVATNVTQGEVQFTFTPVGTASVNDWVSLDDVQLEAGTSNTTFERASFRALLGECAAHYRKTFPYNTAPAQSAGVLGALWAYARAGDGTSAGKMGHTWNFFPPLRSDTYTVTTYNPSAANANWRDVTNNGDLIVNVDPNTSKSGDRILIAEQTTSINASGADIYIHVAADAGL